MRPAWANSLQQAQLQPELIISSTAKRTRKTASRVAKQCGYQGIIELQGTLYLAPPGAYIEALRKVDDAVNRVMVVGHNPGLEQLLTLLTGQQILLPTATLAHVELDVARWRDMNTQTRGTLVDLWRPDSLE